MAEECLCFRQGALFVRHDIVVELAVVLDPCGVGEAFLDLLGRVDCARNQPVTDRVERGVDENRHGLRHERFHVLHVAEVDHAERGPALEQRRKSFRPRQAVAHSEQKVAVFEERTGFSAGAKSFLRDEDVLAAALIVLPPLARRVARHQLDASRAGAQPVHPGALSRTAGAVEQDHGAGTRAQLRTPRQALLLHGAALGPREDYRCQGSRFQRSRFWFKVLARGSRSTFSPEEPGTNTSNHGTWNSAPWYPRSLDKERFVVFGATASRLAALEPADRGHHGAEPHHERVPLAQRADDERLDG